MVENSSYRHKLIRWCLDVLGLHCVFRAVVWLLHQLYCNAWWLIVTNFLPVVIVQFQLDRLMAATELCFAFPIPMVFGTEGQGGDRPSRFRQERNKNLLLRKFLDYYWPRTDFQAFLRPWNPSLYHFPLMNIDEAKSEPI